MNTPRPRLVVRDHAPARPVLLGIGVLLLLLGSAWLAFEWGRSRAGFDGAAARSERAALKDQIAALEEDVRATRLRLAIYESDSTGQLRERTELAKTIGDLQAEVAQLNSDVAFYRGIVEQRTTGDVVKVQQFHVSAGKAEREFLLRLVLGRPLRPEDNISGKARIAIEGTGADGATASLDLEQLAGVAGGELPFSLRFVQTLEQAVKLPQGFRPFRVTVELLPARKGVNPVREAFIWSVEN
jgi:outer membrane murein-binding lipoprotein Lpp